MISKLLYGLETLIATETTLHKLNTFQMKGLRKILGVPPTFIDRSHTDESVRQHIKTEYDIEIKPLTEIVKERRLKLLGHVIRAKEEDPMKEVTFNPNTMEIKAVGFKRVGRPKTHWIHTVMKEAWEEIKHAHPEELQDYDDLLRQKEIIKQTAHDRRYPFHTKPKMTYAQRQARKGNNAEKREARRIRNEIEENGENDIGTSDNRNNEQSNGNERQTPTNARGNQIGSNRRRRGRARNVRRYRQAGLAEGRT